MGGTIYLHPMSTMCSLPLTPFRQPPLLTLSLVCICITKVLRGHLLRISDGDNINTQIRYVHFHAVGRELK